MFRQKKSAQKNLLSKTQKVLVRPTGLEPVPIAGHAPQTCAYADSATAAYHRQRSISYHGMGNLSRLSREIVMTISAAPCLAIPADSMYNEGER